MFQALSGHLQEDTVVYVQHMVLSLCTRVRGGLSVHSLSENCVRSGVRLLPNLTLIDTTECITKIPVSFSYMK